MIASRACSRRIAAFLAFSIASAVYGTSTPSAQPLVPQMGFNNRNATQCGDEFNETTMRDIADKFISLGLRDAGYTYINIDDCWANGRRDKQGDLEANPKRFPSGIRALADYIHQRGLKFGLYSSAGTFTCEPPRENGGFPGSLDHEKRDATTFASWGVDYLKYDNCNHLDIDAQQRYTAMGQALRGAARPIIYSVCERGENQPWTWAGKLPVNADSWRTTDDISDAYTSMLENFKQNVVLDRYATPGHYNDPGILEVGNGGMTDTEYRSHFSLWSIMAAPLLIGTDLRTVKPDTLKILLNQEVIAVDQDPLGIQGRQVRDVDGIHVIVKPLQDGGRAVAVFNENDTPRDVSIATTVIGLAPRTSHTLRDLWAHSQVKGADTLKLQLAAHATAMYRIRED
ncbi:glycoside hydrolase family 27 protein [Dyella choica]|uniref:Alpha-galactosidase n=1 Tax=Dyella choica TaxID=1927959 RepID=A0A3S0RL69_9GAMM|nr:glycoside hydrolase family 27 protein [Dyella choica]RUL76688.1 glycoside hydrolase family 27 protein [Dyella choica]